MLCCSGAPVCTTPPPPHLYHETRDDTKESAAVEEFLPSGVTLCRVFVCTAASLLAPKGKQSNYVVTKQSNYVVTCAVPPGPASKSDLLQAGPIPGERAQRKSLSRSRRAVSRIRSRAKTRNLRIPYSLDFPQQQDRVLL